MQRWLALVLPALLIGLASPAWADKDKDNKGGKGNKHGHGGGPAVLVQPVRGIVPPQEPALVYQYYPTQYSAGPCPALGAPAGPRDRARPGPRRRLPVLPHRILRRPLPAWPRQEGQWLPAAGP